MGRGGDRSQSRRAKPKRFKRRKQPSDTESGRDSRPASPRQPFSLATAWPGYWMPGLVLAAAAVTFGGAIEFPFSALGDRLIVFGNLSALHPQGAGLLSPLRIPFGDRHWGIGALWLIVEGALFGDWPAPF